MSFSKRKAKHRSDGSSIWTSKVIHGPGVWATCVKGKEKQTIGELYEVFETLADELWPMITEDGPSSPRDDSGEDDIEKSILKEVAQLKQPRKQQKFANCRTDTPCVIFISVKPPIDPVRLVQTFVQNVAESGKSRTRFAHRLVPVSNTCDANISQMQTLAKRVILPMFLSEDRKFFRYKIELRIRNHSTLTRDEILNTIAACIPEEHNVDLTNPELFILVEVFKSVCGMSVVPDYYNYNKYNIAEITQKYHQDSELSSLTVEKG